MRTPRLRSFRDLNPYAVGLVSVAVIGLLVALAMAVGVLHLFERTYTVRAEFADVAGLRVGDDVKVAGIQAGRVGSIDVDRRRGLVVVDLVVQRHVDLGPETTAEIALETLLGAKHVRLAGPVEAPFLADLDDGSRVIPRDRTRTPFDLFELTRIATRSVEATDTDRLNQLINQLADVTGGQRDTVSELVVGIDRMARALTQRDEQLRSLLDHSATLTQTLAEKDRTLVALIDASQEILRVIGEREADLGAALRSGARMSGELARLLADNKAELDRILSVLHPTLAVVERNQEALDRTLAWLGPAFLGQSRATSHGPWADIFVQSLGPDAVGVFADVIAGVLEGGDQ